MCFSCNEQMENNASHRKRLNTLAMACLSRPGLILPVMVLLTTTFILAALFFVLYIVSMSFRRTVIFWWGMLPIYLEYQWLKWRRPNNRWPDEAYEKQLHRYYERTAQSLVQLILRLGGISIKIGQVLATIGQGILPNEIVVALRVLQDGVPAKSYEEVATIITASASHNGVKLQMEDLFEWFDPKPLGAASIAQAHLARLKHTNETVVVKVQYPEVRKQLNADLWNMETAVMLVSPENRELALSLRERHERELDFTLEADHLRECATNLQKHGVEPQIVRIPRVRNETGLCSTNVLVMEYLEGVSLSKIIAEEQELLARALGKSSVADLQKHLTELLQGGAQDDPSATPPSGSSSVSISSTKGLPFGLHPRLLSFLQKSAPVWTIMLRIYASVKGGADGFLSTLLRAMKPSILEAEPVLQSSRCKVNLSRVLKTLVYVHGLQFLMDGLYNADPHPGNVLVMPDGRLGLLDYGMIGRLSQAERRNAADVVLALADGDVRETASIYTKSGYKVKVRSVSGIVQDPAVIHRFATFHWDRIDLSPIVWSTSDKTEDVFSILRGAVEHSVPKYIEDGRRLGALMMGPHIQSGRSFSLARSWRQIAQRAKIELRHTEGSDEPHSFL